MLPRPPSLSSFEADSPSGKLRRFPPSGPHPRFLFLLSQTATLFLSSVSSRSLPRKLKLPFYFSSPRVWFFLFFFFFFVGLQRLVSLAFSLSLRCLSFPLLRFFSVVAASAFANVVPPLYFFFFQVYCRGSFLLLWLEISSLQRQESAGRILN